MPYDGLKESQDKQNFEWKWYKLSKIPKREFIWLIENVFQQIADKESTKSAVFLNKCEN